MFTPRRAAMIAVLSVSFAYAPALYCQSAIHAAEAQAHVGQTVVVIDSVAQVTVSRRSNTVFVNFVRPFPDQAFNAVIFSSARSEFPHATEWQGQWLRVSGRVRLYRGKPEIVLEGKRQVAVVGKP